MNGIMYDLFWAFVATMMIVGTIAFGVFIAHDLFKEDFERMRRKKENGGRY